MRSRAKVQSVHEGPSDDRPADRPPAARKDPATFRRPNPGMDRSKDPRALEQELELTEVGHWAWTGNSITDNQHAFGGRLVAQGLKAADLTVHDERVVHSLHASFVGTADGREPITYTVEDTREGNSFSVRRVVGSQGDETVFLLTASFQRPEPGADYELPADPGVVGPEGLDWGRYATPFFDSRDVPIEPSTVPPHTRRAWFRSRVPLPDDPGLHRLGLAFLSDCGNTRAIRQPHAGHPGLENRRSVSLDHSIWFHRPGRVDEWVLTEVHPRATGSGRGLAIGSIRAADGTLLATIAQEAMLRLPGV